MEYVKIESWHIVGEEQTLCGRDIVEGMERAEAFGDDKTCESCFRIESEKEAALVEQPKAE